MVEFREALVVGGADDFLGADRQALREARVGHQEIQLGEEGAEADGVAGAFLAQDDAALLVDFPGFEEQAAGDIGKEGERLAERPGLRVGQLQLVKGAVETGGGVGVTAEFHAEALEELDHIGGREVPAAVERHVLEKVREPALVFVFVDRADPEGEPGADATAGLRIVAQRITQAVGEPAPRHIGINRQVAGLVGKVAGESQQGREQPRGAGAAEPGGRERGHAGGVFRPAHRLQVSSGESPTFVWPKARAGC